MFSVGAEVQDLEYLPDGEEEVAEEKARNVLLRENAQGEYEENRVEWRLYRWAKQCIVM